VLSLPSGTRYQVPVDPSSTTQLSSRSSSSPRRSPARRSSVRPTRAKSSSRRPIASMRAWSMSGATPPGSGRGRRGTSVAKINRRSGRSAYPHKVIPHGDVVEHVAQGEHDAYWFPWRASPWVEGGAMTTQSRERDEQRARKARRPRATPPERTSTPCASSANVPPRPGKRPVRSPGWHTSSASERSRSGVGREADICEARSRGDLGRGRTNP